MKNIVLWAAVAMAAVSASAADPVQVPSAGKIDRVYLYSPEMADTVTVDIWLPESYSADGQKLPVLYMHDGQNLFDASTTWNHQAWEMDSVVTAMATSGEITAPVIVGVHSVSATRVADLMPEAPFKDSSILAELEKPGLINTPLRGDAYAKFMATTLKKYVEDNYNVATGSENTAVMGSSMGGLMSIYILCEYPEVFGAAGCLSTHWVGDVDAYAAGREDFPQAMRDYVVSRIPRDGSHRVYFDRGTATIDAYYGKWDDSIINAVDALGYTRPDRLDSFVDTGAAHEENAWKKRVDRPLRFLFGR